MPSHGLWEAAAWVGVLRHLPWLRLVFETPHCSRQTGFSATQRPRSDLSLHLFDALVHLQKAQLDEAAPASRQ